MEITAKFNFDKVFWGKDKELHLVVGLTAPQLNSDHTRRPLMIMPVLDTSGSMAGHKLEYAKSSLIKLIDHLSDVDYCGLVVFENVAEVLHSLCLMTPENKTELKRKVNSIKAVGGTAFADGMVLGLRQLQQAEVSDSFTRRVIMFTDGNANVGLQGNQILDLISTDLKQVSISAFGYGADANQELLATLSSKANGNYAFIAKPSDAPTAFARELGGLISIYAQNIKIKIVPLADHILSKFLGDYPLEVNGKVWTISLPEMLAEEVQNLVLAFRFCGIPQANEVSENFPCNLAKVIVTYDTRNNGVLSPQELQVPVEVTFVNAADEQLVPHLEVDKIVAVAQMVQVQLQAEKLAAQGNYDQAKYVMQSYSVDTSARGLDHLSKTSAKLADKMSTPAQYLSSQGYRRSVAVGVTKGGMKLAMMDSEAEHDLEEVGTSFSNSFQESVVQSFNGTDSSKKS